MTKLKTKSGAKKRFKVKKSGQVKKARAYGKHLMTHAKSMDRRRRNRGTNHLRDMDAKKVIKEMFPYGAN